MTVTPSISVLVGRHASLILLLLNMLSFVHADDHPWWQLPDPSIDCYGEWEYSTCSAHYTDQVKGGNIGTLSYKQHRTFRIIQQQSYDNNQYDNMTNGTNRTGLICRYPHGYTETLDCVNCQGQFVPKNIVDGDNSGCSGGQREQKYKIYTQKSPPVSHTNNDGTTGTGGGGMDCPYAEGDAGPTQACTHCAGHWSYLEPDPDQNNEHLRLSIKMCDTNPSASLATGMEYRHVKKTWIIDQEKIGVGTDCHHTNGQVVDEGCIGIDVTTAADTTTSFACQLGWSYGANLCDPADDQREKTWNSAIQKVANTVPGYGSIINTNPAPSIGTTAVTNLVGSCGSKSDGEAGQDSCRNCEVFSEYTQCIGTSWDGSDNLVTTQTTKTANNIQHLGVGTQCNTAGVEIASGLACSNCVGSWTPTHPSDADPLNLDKGICRFKGSNTTSEWDSNTHMLTQQYTITIERSGERTVDCPYHINETNNKTELCLDCEGEVIISDGTCNGGNYLTGVKGLKDRHFEPSVKPLGQGLACPHDRNYLNFYNSYHDQLSCHTDCEGAWHYDSCGPVYDGQVNGGTIGTISYKQTRTFRISVTHKNGGKPCRYKHNTKETVDCTNCQGQMVPRNVYDNTLIGCNSGGQREQKYKIYTQKSAPVSHTNNDGTTGTGGGGMDCPYADGDAGPNVACTHCEGHFSYLQPDPDQNNEHLRLSIFECQTADLPGDPAQLATGKAYRHVKKTYIVDQSQNGVGTNCPYSNGQVIDEGCIEIDISTGDTGYSCLLGWGYGGNVCNIGTGKRTKTWNSAMEKVSNTVPGYSSINAGNAAPVIGSSDTTSVLGSGGCTAHTNGNTVDENCQNCETYLDYGQCIGTSWTDGATSGDPKVLVTTQTATMKQSISANGVGTVCPTAQIDTIVNQNSACNDCMGSWAPSHPSKADSLNLDNGICKIGSSAHTNGKWDEDTYMLTQTYTISSARTGQRTIDCPHTDAQNRDELCLDCSGAFEYTTCTDTLQAIGNQEKYFQIADKHAGPLGLGLECPHNYDYENGNPYSTNTCSKCYAGYMYPPHLCETASETDTYAMWGTYSVIRGQSGFGTEQGGDCNENLLGISQLRTGLTCTKCQMNWQYSSSLTWGPCVYQDDPSSTTIPKEKLLIGRQSQNYTSIVNGTGPNGFASEIKCPDFNPNNKDDNIRYQNCAKCVGEYAYTTGCEPVPPGQTNTYVRKKQWYIQQQELGYNMATQSTCPSTASEIEEPCTVPTLDCIGSFLLTNPFCPATSSVATFYTPLYTTLRYAITQQKQGPTGAACVYDDGYTLTGTDTLVEPNGQACPRYEERYLMSGHLMIRDLKVDVQDTGMIMGGNNSTYQYYGQAGEFQDAGQPWFRNKLQRALLKGLGYTDMEMFTIQSEDVVKIEKVGIAGVESDSYVNGIMEEFKQGIEMIGRRRRRVEGVNKDLVGKKSKKSNGKSHKNIDTKYHDGKSHKKIINGNIKSNSKSKTSLYPKSKRSLQTTASSSQVLRDVVVGFTIIIPTSNTDQQNNDMKAMLQHTTSGAANANSQFRIFANNVYDHLKQEYKNWNDLPSMTGSSDSESDTASGDPAAAAAAVDLANVPYDFQKMHRYKQVISYAGETVDADGNPLSSSEPTFSLFIPDPIEDRITTPLSNEEEAAVLTVEVSENASATTGGMMTLIVFGAVVIGTALLIAYDRWREKNSRLEAINSGLTLQVKRRYEKQKIERLMKEEQEMGAMKGSGKGTKGKGKSGRSVRPAPQRPSKSRFSRDFPGPNSTDDYENNQDYSESQDQDLDQDIGLELHTINDSWNTYDKSDALNIEKQENKYKESDVTGKRKSNINFKKSSDRSTRKSRSTKVQNMKPSRNSAGDGSKSQTQNKNDTNDNESVSDDNDDTVQEESDSESEAKFARGSGNSGIRDANPTSVIPQNARMGFDDLDDIKLNVGKGKW